MSNMKNAYYRVYQEGLSVASRFVFWRKAKIIDGAGCASRIPEVLKGLKVTRVMVVTGRHVGKSIAPPIVENLRASGITCVIYDQVEANPTTTKVYEIRDLYLREKCDGFLAIGGGSPIDAAKAAGALTVHPKKKVGDLKGLLKVLKKVPPFVVVPTTSGTGSETTMAAVITDPDTRHKYAIMDPVIIPLYAVLDPLLVKELPQKTTATTGMDALTHAVESYLCVTNFTRDSVLYAEEAVRMIFDNLERAYKDGGDLEARSLMQLAAYKAGWSFGRAGVGNVHAIAHTLGGLYGTPHGLANAVILPIVLEDYGEAVYGKLAKLCDIAGLGVEGSDEVKAKAFIAEIYAMNRRMGIPERLDVIREEDIPQMIEWALAEANPVYPVPVIYDAARCGKVIRSIRSVKGDDSP